MAKQIPGKEIDRFYCQVCGFPCKEGRDSQGNYGPGGWDFVTYTADGSNIISNGGFTAVTTGWTEVDCTLALDASGQSGNCLEVTKTGGSDQYAYQALSSLEFGILYGVTAYVKSGTSGDESYAIQVRTSDRAQVIKEITGTTSSTWTQTAKLLWRAFYGNNVICLQKDSATSGTMFFDTVVGYEYIYSVTDDIGGCPFCGSKNWRK
jgi:hypothetical protein